MVIVKNIKMENGKKSSGANRVIKKQLLFIFLFLFLSLICPMSVSAAQNSTGGADRGDGDDTDIGVLVEQVNTVAQIKSTVAWMPTDDTRFTKPIGQKPIYDKEAAENGKEQVGSESNSNYQKLKNADSTYENRTVE